MNQSTTFRRQRAGSGSFRPQAGDGSVPLGQKRFRVVAHRAAGRLPRSKLWHLAMAVLVAAPLLVAGAFEQLPWQVESWSRTVPNSGPPGAPPPGSESASTAIVVPGTPAVEVTLASTRASPIAGIRVTTPAAPPVPTSRIVTATATTTAVPATLTPTLSPAVSSTPTEDAIVTEMIVTAPLNVRDAPGLDADVRDVLPSGTRLTVIGGPRERDGHDWYEVSGDGVTGWAAGDFLEPA